jgi:hypothetical protein
MLLQGTEGVPATKGFDLDLRQDGTPSSVRYPGRDDRG